MTNDKKYIVRMTNAKCPGGLYIRAFDDLGIAQEYADKMICELDKYNRSHIVDARSIFYAYADHTTKICVSDE